MIEAKTTAVTTAKTIALTNAVLGVIGMIVGILGNYAQLMREPVVETTIGCASLVLSLIQISLWIIFWVKIYGYNKQLGDNAGPRDWQRRVDEWDDDDDRDSPRGGVAPPAPPPETYRPGDPGHYQ